VGRGDQRFLAVSAAPDPRNIGLPRPDDDNSSPLVKIQGILMAQEIIVPLDGSALAAQALPYAEVLARATGAGLVLVEGVAATPHTGEAQGAAEDRACREAEERLDVRCTAIRARGLTADREAVLVAPAALLHNVAQERQASLIVMATHGRSGPSRWVLGSVAEQVLRLTHVPTLLLTPTALAAGDPARLRRRIVVPTDGSEMSQRIFPIAKRLARQLGIPLTLVQAIDPVTFYGALGEAPYSAYRPDLLEEVAADARKGLDAYATAWREEGVSVNVGVGIGQPLGVIEQAVTDEGAGWVAMASHGRGGLGGLVLGSASLAVLRRATVPVLIAAGSVPAPARAPSVA
jgi:nucleotide-binding universal stress UspA family protein